MARILEEYANRGVFRGFSGGQLRGAKAIFTMLWHRDRSFELILDVRRNTMRFPVVLPEVPRGSSMYQEFKEFIESRHSEKLPEHRRIDRRKARVRSSNRGGDVSLTLTVEDRDYEYGARKFIHLVHEVYMVFLSDGRYYEYMVDKFDVDPDRI